MLGGLGICGQPFCCSRFLDDFQPVSIKMAKEQGFDLPFIYNTSGYEKRDVIRELDGIMDVYLPDLKY